MHQAHCVTPSIATGLADRCWEWLLTLASWKAEGAFHEAKVQEVEAQRFSPFEPAVGHE